MSKDSDFSLVSNKSFSEILPPSSLSLGPEAGQKGLKLLYLSLVIEQYVIYRADIWILPIYRYQLILSASVGVDKMQTTCARKYNEPSQENQEQAI